MNIDLLKLEDRLLCAVMNGGEIPDVTLTHFNQAKLEILKYERNTRGAYYIHEDVIEDGVRIKNLGDEAPAVESLVKEIQELQKKELVSDVFKKANFYLPAEIMLAQIREELDKIDVTNESCKITNGAELKKSLFQNTEFLVEKILPVGLTVLSGAPKSGKSWLTLLLADSLTGKFPLFLGKSVKKVPCLIYSLEDSLNRSNID